MITFAREPFGDVIEELKPLFERHWAEIARNRELIVLDPNYDRYAAMETAGLVRMFIGREDGAVVGYAVYFVAPHMHYRNDKWAVCDIIWLAPEHRKGTTGIRLFKFVEKYLRGENVSVMHTTGKEAHPALARVLEYLGHARIEFGYAKLLKERA